MDFEERERKRDRISTIIKLLLFLGLISMGLMFLTGNLDLNVNEPIELTEPKLQLRYDEFP